MRALLLALLALNLTGCGSPTLSATVSDITGEPLVGAMATVVGTLCQEHTDTEGSFNLKCKQRGAVQVAISQTGYITKSIEWVPSSAKQTDLGRVHLIKVPSQPGLFLFDGGSYKAMQPGAVKRSVEQGPSVLKSYCIDRDRSAENRRPAGTTPLFDNGHDGWRIWKLDAEGCAWRMRCKNARSKCEAVYRERVRGKERQLEETKRIVLVDLGPGEYFIADWSAGIFVKNRAASEESGEDLFSGHYLIIE